MNRTRIKTASGPKWLSIPVLTKGKKQQRLYEVLFDQNHQWAGSHLKSLQVSYQNSPYFFFLADEISEFIQQRWSIVDDLLFRSTEFLCKKMRLLTMLVKSRDLPVVKDRSQRVVEWLRECGCYSYLVRPKDEQFVNRDEIENHDLSIETINFTQPHYHQLYSGFVPNLSGLDLLFNEGELSKSILLKSVTMN